jgi:tetratricopeptide (TPR) repeat protein
MKGDTGGSAFLHLAEPILRRLIENIDSPFVWMPLGLFILCVLAYPVTKKSAFAYLAIAFVILTFGADWVGRWHNRAVPPEPLLQEDSFEYLASVQQKAAEMMEAGKEDAAHGLTEKHLRYVDKALASHSEDADFQALMGYYLKNLYQSSKGLDSSEERNARLSRAQRSFENALRLDPKNPSAHNGMGNVLFLEGRFDEAIKEYDTALKLTNGEYSQAEHDKRLAEEVKAGQIPFDH